MRNGTHYEVLVFAARDSSFVEEAQRLADAVGGRYIDRLSSSLDDLLLVARHRVVEPVAVVVLLCEKIVLRYPRLVRPEVLLGELAAL